MHSAAAATSLTGWERLSDVRGMARPDVRAMARSISAAPASRFQAPGLRTCCFDASLQRGELVALVPPELVIAVGPRSVDISVSNLPDAADATNLVCGGRVLEQHGSLVRLRLHL